VDLDWIAELACKVPTLGQHGVELVVGRLQSASQVCVLDWVWVALASEARVGLW
jgi:hypothetical protein